MRNLFDTLRQDITYGLRQLARSPGFAIIAIASLAIGIGANITIFSAADAFLRRPPNAVHPEQLVRIYRGDHSPLPRDWYLHFARNGSTLSELVAEDPLSVGLAHDGTTERAMGMIVSENYFRALGVGAALGNVFVGKPGESVGQVAVLNHRFWVTNFGADPTIVGRALRMNDQLFTIIGVAQEGFYTAQFGWGANVYLPMSELPRLRGVAPGELSQSSFYITGRLAKGRTPQQAQSEVLALATSIPDAPADIAAPGAFKVERARGITAEVRTPATVVSAFLFAVVGVVLLIACANLANLLLARASTRRREIAVRLALGVRRSRLVQQLLTESVLVSSIAGVAGFGVAMIVTRLLPRVLPANGEFAFDMTPNGTVLGFAVLLAIGTGALFGLAPALHASRVDLQEMLRSETAGSGSRRSRLRSTFLVAQVGLATVLLVMSALFIKSLDAAQRINPGFRSERVADLAIDLSLRQYDSVRARAWYQQALDAARGLPGVEAASLIGFVPLSGSNSGTGVLLPNDDPSDRRAARGTTFTTVAPGYFEMFGVPIVRGRGFDAGDRAGSLAVIVVNESFARMMWPSGDPIGQRIRFVGGDLATVVGVTPDTKYKSLADHNEPFLYLPWTQSYAARMVLQVRFASNAPASRTALRSAIQVLDPALPLPSVTSMEDDMRIALLPSRLGAALLGIFGVLALFLATIGVYGVTAYLVRQRTAEIGIRSALGATRRSVLVLMMRETITLVLVGLGLGVAAGVGGGSLASSWLYGVGALDPVSLVSASGVLLVVALFGTWLPARHALRIDPVRALRSE